MSTATRAHRSETGRSKKKLVAILALAVLLVGGGTGVYAYWSYTGAGTGAGAVGTPTANIVVKQTSTVSNLAPGSGTQALSGTFDNSNSGPVYVTSIAIGQIQVTKATGAAAGTCDYSDFTLSANTITIGREIPKGVNQDAWGGVTISFSNKSTNQDQCKGATITIPYTAS